MSDNNGNVIQEAEFSRIIRVDNISEDGEVIAFSATDAERETLAARMGLLALDSLQADVTASPLLSRRQQRGPYKGIHLHVAFKADVVQSCVVTLEPVAATVSDEFEVDFLPKGADPADVIDTGTPRHSGRRDKKKEKKEETVDDWLEGLEDGEMVFDSEEADPPEILRAGVVEIGELIVENLSLSLDPYPRHKDVEMEKTQSGNDEGDVVRDNPFAVLASLKSD